MKSYKTNEYTWLCSRSTLRTTLRAPITNQAREGRWQDPTIRKSVNNQIVTERGGGWFGSWGGERQKYVRIFTDGREGEAGLYLVLGQHDNDIDFASFETNSTIIINIINIIYLIK